MQILGLIHRHEDNLPESAAAILPQASLLRRRRLMSLFDDLINYELCFPGAVTGSTEVECPHCEELLTVPVDAPMGEESCQCCERGGGFDVDWGEGTISYHRVAD